MIGQKITEDQISSKYSVQTYHDLRIDVDWDHSQETECRIENPGPHFFCDL